MTRPNIEKTYTDDDRHGLPYLKDYRVFQVTTHGHDRPIGGLLPSWKEFANEMHRDNVPIPQAKVGLLKKCKGPARSSTSGGPGCPQLTST
jgi:hypothetical protein